MVKHWRSQACRIVVYLDDGLGACPSFTSALEQSSSVRADLVSSGFVPSESKCNWFPTQDIKWLGLDWDLRTPFLSIPKLKIERLPVAIDEALANERISARRLATVTGLIMSNVVVFGNICKFMTKALHGVIETRTGWNSCVILDSRAVHELQFWRAEVHNFNYRSLAHKSTVPTRFVYSDASYSGCAAFISRDDCPIYYKNWGEIEMRQSSTWRELQCVSYALDSFKSLLRSHTVKWFTDNQCVQRILEAGSMKEHPHKIALDIYYCARQHDISLEVEWIPRTQNQKADYLGKIIDFDDRHVKDKYFQAASAYWSTCAIDCFASCENKKVPKFYSKFFSPGTSGVDAFSFNWSGEFCWLAPPLCLISRVTLHVCISKCRAVLVVPVWPSAHFIIIDYIYVECGKDVFEHGGNKLPLFGSDNFNGAVVFLLLYGARRLPALAALPGTHLF